MKERLGVFAIAVMFTFGAGFVIQDPKEKTQGDTGIKGQRVTTDKNQQGNNQQGKNQQGANATLSDSDFVRRVMTNNRAEIELGQLALTKASSADVKQFAQRMIDDHTRAANELTQLAQSKGWSVDAAGTSNTSNTSTAGTTDANRTSGSTATGDRTSGSTSTNNRTSGSTATNNRTGGSTATGDRTGGSTSATGRTSGSDADKWSDSNRNMAMDDQQMQTDHRARMDRLNGLSGAEFDREYMRHMVMDHQKAVALFERQSKNKGGDDALENWAEKMLPALREHHRMARDVAGKVGAKLTDAPANSSNR